MPHSPLQLYQQQLTDGILKEDAEQCLVIEKLDTIYHQLIKRARKRNSVFGRWRRKVKPLPPIQGLYIWGGVGIGKTYLIDLFYQSLPVKKLRMHFYLFMQRIHDELKKIQGQKNPLQLIAKKLADEYSVICFDEFFVSNITDAMLLGELFESLFFYGLCLITTSNIAPDDLYQYGIQRERFLPAIQALKKYTDIIHMKTESDYRQQHIKKMGVYYTPLNQQAKKNMQHSFNYFSKNSKTNNNPIELFGRQIKIIQQANQTIWFDFKAICGRPRSQRDYLALVKNYHTVLVSNIPIIEDHQVDLITSFIQLVDVLYDAHLRIVISAAAPIEQLYTGKKMQFEYQRTQSRLVDMQSEAYIDHKTTGPELTAI